LDVARALLVTSACVVFALSDAALACAAPSQRDRPWLIVTDIHLDPTGRQARGTYGTDSTPALLGSTIRAMQRVEPAPPVVLIGGDFFAHIFDARLAVPTMRSIAAEFARAFPHAQFVVALGNEDSNCGDYQVPASSAFLRAVTRAWEPLVDRAGAAPDFARTFPREGFYVARLPRPGLRAVVIDDVFWSPRYRNACRGAARPAQATLRDLRTALAAGNGEHTWVLMHIPPGIDAYSTVHITHGLVIVPFLDAAARQDFVDVVTRPSSRVSLVVATHTHKFAFRVATQGRDRVPLLLAPSVSPIFDNAPSFLRIDVDRHGTIDGVEDWTLLGTRWGDRGGLTTLGMSDVSVASILGLQRRLASDVHLRATFARLYNGDAPPEIDASNWRAYWCAATEMSATAFRSCAAVGGYSIVTARGFIAAGVVGVIVVIGGFALFRWRHVQRTRRQEVARP